MFSALAASAFCQSRAPHGNGNVKIAGELSQWQKVTLTEFMEKTNEHHALESSCHFGCSCRSGGKYTGYFRRVMSTERSDIRYLLHRPIRFSHQKKVDASNG